MLYYHYDNLGSTQALTDESGTILSTYSYGVYGELLSGDTTLTSYLYNGAYGVHTDENGLYYMRARYYNTDISRFINQDILRGNLSASQSLNRYAYCQGNPLNQNDPFGLCPQGMTQKDWIHIGLSIAGMIPVLGIAANVVNSAMYFYEGDVLNGALCLAGALIGASGFFSAFNAVKKSCELVQLVGAIEKAGIMITAAASADMTILSAAKTLVLLHENNYVLSGEILLAAADTVMSAMGTMEAFNAIDISTRRTQRMLEEAHCFPAGTKVLTDEGLKNIEDIQPGDYVYSTNDETGESDYKEVLQVFVRETEVIAHVRYEDAEGNTTDIETTLNHRFWSEGEWKSAGTLKAGETLTLSDGSQVIILEITFEDRHETVYNMEVADYHTYYVGEDSVWVHNNTYGQQPRAVSGRYSEEEIQNIISDLKGDGFEKNPLRQAYENEVVGLKEFGEELLARGMSEEEVARILNQARRDLGIKYKNLTPQLLRDYIYEINMGRYGDKLGPTYDYLFFNKGRSNMDVINSASTPNPSIDDLLSGFEEWLRRQ